MHLREDFLCLAYEFLINLKISKIINYNINNKN